METIFTKIINGDIPCTKIYEDADSFAFLDINPLKKGHTLLITKEPYQWMQDVPDTLLAKMFVQSKKIILAIKTALECDYVQVMIVGKDVPHFHIHLVPRMFTDNIHDFTIADYRDGEAVLYAAKITGEIEE